jgi:hypothetical protein
MAVAAAIFALGIGFGVGYAVAPSHDGHRFERVGPQPGRVGLLPNAPYPGPRQFPHGKFPGNGNGNGNGTGTPSQQPSAPSTSPSK